MKRLLIKLTIHIFCLIILLTLNCYIETCNKNYNNLTTILIKFKGTLKNN